MKCPACDTYMTSKKDGWECSNCGYYFTEHGSKAGSGTLFVFVAVGLLVLSILL
jgi:uncharacterized protein (DUF983 family)